MSDVTIKQVEGGQIKYPAKTDAVELELSGGSYWAQVMDLWNGMYLPTGLMVNAKISATVASNNLTVSFVPYGGSVGDTNPMYFDVGGAVKRVSAARSVTLAAGTNWMGLGGAMFATKEQDLFVYSGWNETDDVVIAVSRVPNAEKYSDFSTTSTDATYAAISTITNAAADDKYFLVGRFAATLSAGAGYTWTVPTYTATNLVQHPVHSTRWMDWLPTFTNLDTATATIVAKYQIDEHICRYQFSLVFGASTAISGSVSHTLPFARGVFSGVFPNALVRLYDATGSSHAGLSYLMNATSAGLFAQGSAAATVTVTSLSSTVPFTWTTSDEIEVFSSAYAI